MTHIEFRIPEQLACELATLAPMAWIETFSRRLSLCQQQQQQHPAVPSEFLSLRSLIRLPWLTSRAFPSVFFLQPVRSAQQLRFERFCSSVNSCQRSASGLLQSLVRLATSLYPVASTFAIVPVLGQGFNAMLWPVLAIRTACLEFGQKNEPCTIHSSHD